MPDAAKLKAQSKFNFFAILEDTISGVIEFVLRFIGVTFLCLFRPRLCIARYRQANELPAGVFPRPYTYLVLCVFVFIKGLHWISQSTPSGSEKAVTDSSFLIEIHHFVDKLSDISTLQIILSVFPTIVVILCLSSFVTLLHRPFINVSYRQASHVFSYIFGSQIVGALLIIAAFVGFARLDPAETDFTIAIVGILLGATGLAVASTLALQSWYAMTLKHKLTRLGLYLLYTVIVVAIGILYMSTIVAAYSKLESEEAGEAGASGSAYLAKVTPNKDVQLSVYQVASKNNQLQVSIYLENHGDTPYLLHDKASVLVMNLSLSEMEQMFSQQGSAQLDPVLLREYLKLLKGGLGRIELSLQDKDPRQSPLIRPNEQRVVTYQGAASGNFFIGPSISGTLSLPAARFKQNGTVDYITLSQNFGSSAQGVYSNLEKQRQEIDRKFDVQIDEAQKEFGDTLKELDEAIRLKNALDAQGGEQR